MKRQFHVIIITYFEKLNLNYKNYTYSMEDNQSLEVNKLCNKNSFKQKMDDCLDRFIQSKDIKNRNNLCLL